MGKYIPSFNAARIINAMEFPMAPDSISRKSGREVKNVFLGSFQTDAMNATLRCGKASAKSTVGIAIIPARTQSTVALIVISTGGGIIPAATVAIAVIAAKAGQ